MQDFGKKVGWARVCLFISALLLIGMGVACFVAPHGFLPEVLHNTTLPEGLAPGSIAGAIVMAILGIVELAAFNAAGKSKYLSGFLFLSGFFALVCCVAALVDPLVGTLSYEWVIALLMGVYGVILFLEAVAAGRKIGYKGWGFEVLMALVLICLAVGVLLDSAMAEMLAGVGFFALAIETIAKAAMSGSIKVAA